MRDGRRGLGQPLRRQERRARRRRARQIDQRMADELDRHAAVAIDRFLERKNHQHEIREPADRLEPLRRARPRSAG